MELTSKPGAITRRAFIWARPPLPRSLTGAGLFAFAIALAALWSNHSRMTWQGRITEAAVGGATGLLITVVYIALGESVTPAEWLQFTGIFLGVAATMGGTLWIQHRNEVSGRKASEIEFASLLNRADDALLKIIEEGGDEWRYVATVDTALLHVIPAKNGFKNKSFQLDVAISALLSAWEACGPKMRTWANQIGNDHPEAITELRATSGHIQDLVREALSEFNRTHSPGILPS